MLQLAWPLISTGRYSHLADVADQGTSLFQTLRLSPPSQPPNPTAILEWRDFVARLSKRLNAVENAQRYFTRLDNLSTSRSLEVLSREYTKLVDELSDTSEQLWHCWLRLQPNRLTQQERRLLSEYSSLLQIIVATKDSSQTADARVFRQYHAAFPNVVAILSCWAVTSLSARGRIPLQPAFFDVLVIDEASQCDIASAIPLLYRAKRAVIIGDPQQLKHISSISPKQDRALLAKHNLVEGNLAWGYSGNSLFDVARSMCRTDDIISLRDHHRSHADIIGFSNQHFYGGLLRIATKYERLKLAHPKDPSVRWIDIRGKVVRPPDGAAVNSLEAEAVVKELEHLVIQQNYGGTVGVVTPFRSQANRIRDLVHQNDALASRLDHMEFLVNTVHQFQGDERDLIIFSPVVSKGMADSAVRFLGNNPYLFNVAVTRARAALLVIGDRQAAIDSGVDYLKKFAIYAESLGSQPSRASAELLDFGPEYPPVSNPERVSDWERVFYRQLYAAGVRTIPQYNVDQYALDLALLKDHRRLDIEVDGEHHRDWDGEVCRRDQIRNQRLMELGWDVMRFWVYQIRDETDECISRVQRWITQ